MNNKIIGQRINTLLAIKNMKQKELAKELGITDNTVSYFVNGSRVPNIQQIIKISQIFNVSTDYILGVTNAMSTDADIKAICEYTGLNDWAVSYLHSIKDSVLYNTLINDFLQKKDDRIEETVPLSWYMDDIINYYTIQYWRNHIEHTYINSFINDILKPDYEEDIYSLFEISENKINLKAYNVKFHYFIKEKLKIKHSLEWYEEHYLNYDEDYAEYMTKKNLMTNVKIWHGEFEKFLKEWLDKSQEEGVTVGNNTEEK